MSDHLQRRMNGDAATHAHPVEDSPVRIRTTAIGEPTRYIVLEKSTVRAGPEKSDPKVGEYARGQEIMVVLGTTNSVGLEVLQSVTPCGRKGGTGHGGWVKLATSKGRVLLEKVEDEQRLESSEPPEPGLEPDRAAEFDAAGLVSGTPMQPEPEPEPELRPGVRQAEKTAAAGTGGSSPYAGALHLSREERAQRLTNNVFRVIRQQMRGNRSLYGQKLADAQRVFALMDVDGSGTMTAEEFSDALTRMGLGLTAVQVGEVLATVDADGSGTIEYDEFVALLGAEFERPVRESGVEEAQPPQRDGERHRETDSETDPRGPLRHHDDRGQSGIQRPHISRAARASTQTTHRRTQAPHAPMSPRERARQKPQPLRGVSTPKFGQSSKESRDHLYLSTQSLPDQLCIGFLYCF